ncbi:MAG: UDP-N-acetylglucosamine 1-carboxyvinyltransferase [Pseudomonadota bacterium]
MDILRIVGGAPLSGQVTISGAKNAALPLLCVPLLTDKPVTFSNLPCLKDVTTMTRILSELGCDISFETIGYEHHPFGQTMTVQCRGHKQTEAHYDLIRQMRAGMLVLGPLLARYGQAKVSLPGGCAIGTRPVDIHLEVMRELGAHIDIENGYIVASAPDGLKGADIQMRFPSVGATENLMNAAVLARGTTVIRNAACEPEIVDLAQCLIAGGAKISGHGTSTITIEGVEELGAISHAVMYDRIEAGTYMVAAAMTCGDLVVKGAVANDNRALIERMRYAGVEIDEIDEATLRVAMGDAIFKHANIDTQPYPGFPTDLQAQFMAMMCLGDGVSVVNENIFENRFMHVPELCRMGANISIKGHMACIEGIQHFNGAHVMATDLRASSSLVLAALAARGETQIHRLYHLDRGYECIEEKLRSCGAVAERIKEN